MGIRVIVDTNCALNEKVYDLLLGNRKELESIAEFATIFLPDIVIDEIIEQKRTSFNQAKGDIQHNALFKYMEVDINQIEELSFKDFETKLRGDQSIPYKVISLSDKSKAFEKSYRLAISHSAPFKIGSDKGFKDTCIALITDEFLKTLDSEERVFLFSKDERLKEYFTNNKMIISIDGLEDLKSKLIIKGQEEEELTTESIKNASESDSIEIKEPTPGEKAKSALLTEFRNSSSFLHTHLLVDKLAFNEKVFNEKDFCDILRSACNNRQIYWILGDSDIAEFLIPVFEKYGKCLDSDSYNRFIQYSGVTED